MLDHLILVLNCGSSSIKFSILNLLNRKNYLYGQFFSSSSSKFQIQWNINNISYKKIFKKEVLSYDIICYIIKDIILKQPNSFIRSIKGIGHRVVHGGYKLKRSMLINKKVISHIKESSCFAPIHNPVNLLGIKLAMDLFPNLSKKNVAVFDTAFYCSLPEAAYLYAIPYDFYKKYKIRRYGAHGISHGYVTNESSKILNKPKKLLNIISCHLGNGCSIAAISNGVCIDISMGLTPLEGLVMGTRSGDLDPAIIFFMHNQLNLSMNTIENILNTQSGLLGLNQVSNDCEYATQNYFVKKSAKRSIDVFCYRLSKYIAGYSILMDKKIDAVVFTGGIGENSILVRTLVISKLTSLGLKIDESYNSCNCKNKSFFINYKGTIPILVIPTNENLFIAKETMNIIDNI